MRFHSKTQWTLLLAFLLLLSASVTGYATTFSDVLETDWFYNDVTDLSQMGIINGRGDGDFHPLDSIQVDEFIKLIVTATGFVSDPGTSYWASPFIEQALSEGILLPDEFEDYTRPIRRGEMATLINRAMAIPTDNAMYEVALFMADYLADPDEDVLQAFYLGIITGYPDGAFHPDNLATRAEASAMLMRMIFPARRVDTDRFGVLTAEIETMRQEYGALQADYLALYEAGIDPEPHLFENGDLLYESETGTIDAYLWADGNLYIGPVEQGHFGGLGYFSWTDGAQFFGEIENDQRTGRGVMTFNDAVYAGDFLEGDLTGRAVLQWDDGYTFTGHFESGQVEGLNKRLGPDGSFHLGYFEEGLPQGMGLEIDESGLAYFGSFEKGEKDYDEAFLYRQEAGEVPFRLRVAEALTEALEPGMDPSQKIRALHDYLIRQVTYDSESYESGDIPYVAHTAYGALVEGRAVCDGYASAYNLLLNEAGIESDLVYGQADGENHAWNLVAFPDGDYYVDVTWDDGDDGKVRTTYFKKTIEEMNQDHVIEHVVR